MEVERSWFSRRWRHAGGGEETKTEWGDRRSRLCICPPPGYEKGESSVSPLAPRVSKFGFFRKYCNSSGASRCHVKSPLMNGIRSFPNSDPLTVLFIPAVLHMHTCGHTVRACPRNVCAIQSLAALCLPLMLSSPGDQRPHSRAGH